MHLRHRWIDLLRLLEDFHRLSIIARCNCLARHIEQIADLLLRCLLLRFFYDRRQNALGMSIVGTDRQRLLHRLLRHFIAPFLTR